tara:strand:+ start:78653 stop:79270 length:618 start_codon:yes stop_codon:yes gene_type:complete
VSNEAKKNTVISNVTFAIEMLVMVVLLVLPLPVPALIPLVVLASVALEVRGLGWSHVGLQGKHAARDSATGLVLGLLVASLLPLAVGQAAESDFLLLQGNGRALVAALLLTLALSAASEMLFRGYAIAAATRVWGDSGAIAGLLVGAVSGTIATQPASAGAALGAFVIGLGYGLLYFASGRRLILPITMHFVVDAYPIVLEFLRN